MKRIIGALTLGTLWACGPATPAETQQNKALKGVKANIQTNLNDLAAATGALCAAAPVGTSAGWSTTGDRPAIDAMKTEWSKARRAYENVEGAIQFIFQELDVSTDQRYDFFIESAADDNLFDDQGVTGIHAVERILWADSHPASVVTFESGLAHYKAAAFPANQTEASDFKNKLCARLARETAKMRDDFAPLALDTSSAYRGVIASMGEQIEKLDKAATGEEESRYAQITLADMRANLAGGRATYDQFRPWLLEKSNGVHLDEEIRTAFDRVSAAYARITGDALPAVPSTWSSQNPSQADLATPFGQLFSALKAEGDETRDGSLVFDMNESADALGIPQLPEE